MCLSLSCLGNREKFFPDDTATRHGLRLSAERCILSYFRNMYIRYHHSTLMASSHELTETEALMSVSHAVDDAILSAVDMLIEDETSLVVVPTDTLV